MTKFQPENSNTQKKMMKPKFQRLVDGETFETSEKGNSMVPLLYSGEKHVLTPVRLEDVQVGDIVYCKVKGCFYTHLVKGCNKKRGLLIGNNHGGINGWTKQVFGRVVRPTD